MTDGVVSIIVPTYKEAGNIGPLVRKIDEAMNAEGIRYEVIFVDDDSRDGLLEETERLEQRDKVQVIIRKRERGLATAVMEGIRRARGSILAVMDADLSHPPDRLPHLVMPIISGKADFTVGSRFVRGGSSESATVYRRVNAWASNFLARPLTDVRDPLSGYFAFPRALLSEHVLLDPVGFKIGLEIIVKTAPRRIVEIPIHFRQRRRGKSKLNIFVQVRYLKHLKGLYFYKFFGTASRV